MNDVSTEIHNLVGLHDDQFGTSSHGWTHYDTNAATLEIP